MGGIGSHLKKEEIEELIRISGCNQKLVSLGELKKICKKFDALNTEQKEFVSIDDLLALPDLENNPLKDRIARLMTLDMGEIINFRLFVETISLFEENAKAEEKFKFFFRIYDVDNDGFVGESELLFVFKTLAGHEYNDEELQGIVDQLIYQFDHDRDRKLNYEEFISIFTHPEMEFLYLLYPPDPGAILPLSLFVLFPRLSQSRSPVLLAVPPAAHILLPRRPEESPAAVLFVHQVLPLVPPAVGPGELPPAVHLALLPRPAVMPAVGPRVLSQAFQAAFFEVSLVPGPVGPGHGAWAALDAVHEVRLADGAVFPVLEPCAVLLAVEPLAFVGVLFELVRQLAFAAELAGRKLAFVDVAC